MTSASRTSRLARLFRHRAPIYYVDLTVRAGLSLVEAIGNARSDSESRKASGFDQAALDEAARQGFAA